MSNDIVPAAAEGMPNEAICDRIQRLSEELAEALAEWANGQFSAVIYPANHPSGIIFRNVGATPESRLTLASAAYQQCAREVDPTVTEWWSWSAADDDNPLRFGLYGSRPQGALK